MKDGMIRRSRWARMLRNGEAGQALVETALTAPMLVAMFIGSVELARISYAAIEMSNAARAAVQYAAMDGGGYNDNASTGGIWAAAEADAAYVYQNSTGFNVTSSVACTCSGAGTATCSPPGGCAGSKVIVTVTVTTSANFDPLLRLPGLPTSYTLKGYAQQDVLM